MVSTMNKLVTLALCVAVLICLVGWVSNSQASNRVAWEYQIVRIRIETNGEPILTMNKLGDEGWEFVQFIHEDEIAGSYNKYLFKRAK